MSLEAQMVLQGLLFVILTVVGLLLIWLHFRLQELLESRKKMPALADDLTEVMLKARTSIAQLMTGVSEQAPELDNKLHEAQKVLQEFDYVMDRENKVLERLDGQLEKARNQAPELLAVPKREQKKASAEKQEVSQNSATITPLRPAVAAAYGAGAAPQEGKPAASDAEDELRRALSQRL